MCTTGCWVCWVVRDDDDVICTVDRTSNKEVLTSRKIFSTTLHVELGSRSTTSHTHGARTRARKLCVSPARARAQNA